MPESRKLARNPEGRIIAVALALIGFTATAAQVVLMRELMVVFHGNELSLGLMLASWLMWTAAGSGLLGKLRLGAARPERLVAALEVLISAAFPLSLAAVRFSRQVFQPVTGEMLGPGQMLATGFAVLAPFCVLSGWLFAAGTRLRMRAAGEGTAAASARVYLLEAAGSAAGGLAASLVWIRRVDSFTVAWMLAAANLLAAARLLSRRGLAVAAAGLMLAPAWAATRFLENVSLCALWRGFTVLESRNSAYGNLTVVETEGSRTLYETGLAAGTVPDPGAAEEAVHYALLQHPWPRRLLLIGGGWQGALAEALKHPSIEAADYVELDPAVPELAGRHFAAAWAAARRDPRVRVHLLDGRLYVRRTRERFDVIIVNLPEPETAQLNRFYTLEFFREAARRLDEGGVLSVRLRAAENYLSPELARLLASIHATLRAAFAQVVALPGETVHFFAAARPGVLARDAGELQERLRARGVETRYVREYYFRFRLLPARVRMLEEQMAAAGPPRLNRDFAPMGYYYGVTRWSAQFDRRYRAVLEAAGQAGFVPLASAVLLAAAAAAWRAARCGGRGAAAVAVTAMGFTLMALQVLLLVGFQVLFGYVYHQLALIVGAFMAGMALGSRQALGCAAQRDAVLLAFSAGLAALSGFALFAALRLLAPASAGSAVWLAGHVAVPALAAACGWMGGFQFAVASRLYFRQGSRPGPGGLYALDLAGACAGALATSGYLLPVFGYFKTACLLAIVNLPGAFLAWRAAARR